MITLAEVFHNPTYTFFIGLSLGLWVAVNVWIFRWARGYRAGVKMCTDMLELKDMTSTFPGALAAIHINAEMRRQASQAFGPEETRH